MPKLEAYSRKLPYSYALGVFPSLMLMEAHPELAGQTGVPAGVPITKADLYFLGLTGGEGSGARRDLLCGRLGFPRGMTPTAFLSALNLLYTKEQLEQLCGDLFGT